MTQPQPQSEPKEVKQEEKFQQKPVLKKDSPAEILKDSEKSNLELTLETLQSLNKNSSFTSTLQESEPEPSKSKEYFNTLNSYLTPVNIGLTLVGTFLIYKYTTYQPPISQQSQLLGPEVQLYSSLEQELLKTEKEGFSIAEKKLKTAVQDREVEDFDSQLGPAITTSGSIIGSSLEVPPDLFEEFA